MPRIAEEPLTKVTLNLFTKDVDFLRLWYDDYTIHIRQMVRDRVNQIRIEDEEDE